MLPTDSSLTKDFVAGDPSLAADNLKKKKKKKPAKEHAMRPPNAGSLTQPNYSHQGVPLGGRGEVSFHFCIL